MRCREALAMSTYLALKELGGEWEAAAEAADEDELCRIGRRIRRARESGATMTFAQVLKKAR